MLQIHVDSALCLNFVLMWLLAFENPQIFKSLLFQCITICKFTVLLSICVFHEHVDCALCLKFLTKWLLDSVSPPII